MIGEMIFWLQALSPVIVYLLGKISKRRFFIFYLSLLSLVLSEVLLILSYIHKYEILSFGGLLKFSISFDKLSLIVSIFFTTIFISSYIFSYEYIKERYLEYSTIFLILFLGVNGMLFSGDFISLYFFYELLGISSYLLVSFNKTKEAIEGSIKYAVMEMIGSSLLLLGILVYYIHFGDFSFRNFGSLNKIAILSFLFIFSGFGIKSAIFPFYTWLPDAHSSAPSPISAILSGTVVEASLISFIKIFFTLGYPNFPVFLFLLSLFSIPSMLIPSLSSLTQRDIKRMLAYSTLYNMGVVLAGISVGTPFSISSSVLYLISHSLSKATLFLNSGSLIRRVGSRDIEEISKGSISLFEKILFSLSLFSISSLPPFFGFWAKVFLFLSLIQGLLKLGYVFIFVLIAFIISSVVSAGYYLGILFKKISLNGKFGESSNKILQFSVTILVLLILTLSFFVFHIFREISLSTNFFS